MDRPSRFQIMRANRAAREHAARRADLLANMPWPDGQVILDPLSEHRQELIDRINSLQREEEASWALDSTPNRIAAAMEAPAPRRGWTDRLTGWNWRFR